MEFIQHLIWVVLELWEIKFCGILNTVGTIIAVGTLMIIGIRYMMAAPEEKADIKARSIPFAIGAVILFGAVNIVSLIETFAKLFKN